MESKCPTYRFFAPAAFLVMVLMLVGCGEDAIRNSTDFGGDSTTAVRDTFSNVPDSVFGIPKAIVDMVTERPADGFDFPVGPPEAQGYFKARGVIVNEHYGEDWNGSGGGNTDFGDLVHAVADGVVFYAREFRPGWGMVIRMLHNAGTAEKPVYVESLYAHCASIWVKPGNYLKRGDPIGTIGNADKIYHAHLHFEMRTQPNMPISWREGGDINEFLDPTDYIRNNRKLNNSKSQVPKFKNGMPGSN